MMAARRFDYLIGPANFAKRRQQSKEAAVTSHRGSVLPYLEFVRGERHFESRLLGPAVRWMYARVLPGVPSSWIRYLATLWTSGDDDRKARAADRCLEVYMVLTTVILGVGVMTQVHPDGMQFTPGRPSGATVWLVAVIVVGFLRLVEILSQAVEVILERIFVGAMSALTTLAFYVLQSVAIFTICAEFVGPNGFISSDNTKPKCWTDFLYMTWINMTTLGSSYTASSALGRLVVAASTSTAILLFSVLLGYVVGKLGKKQEAK
ncbi:hypothetical protein [Nocardia tengchongensis]|uniref:hypothetical protein n=1 Tax=Nocardia tengchongensis TaxID=2055889 RepID=UPI0036BB1B5B